MFSKEFVFKDNLLKSLEVEHPAGNKVEVALGRRNPSKFQQFFKARESGDLPPYICDMFDKAYLSPEGERQKRTDIVNSLFEKAEKGKGWKVCLEKPLFEEAKTRQLQGDAIFFSEFFKGHRL